MTTSTRDPRWLALTGWITLGLGLLAVIVYGVSVETGWAPWHGDESADVHAETDVVGRQLDYAWRVLGGHRGQVKFSDLTRDPARLAEAGRAVDLAIERVPHHPRAWLMRGLQLYAQGEQQAGIEALQASIEYGGGVQNFVVLGALHVDMEQTDEAILVLQRAVERYPESLEAWNNLGQAFWLSGRQAEAEAAFRRQLEIEQERQAEPGR